METPSRVAVGDFVSLDGAKVVVLEMRVNGHLKARKMASENWKWKVVLTGNSGESQRKIT